MIDLLKFNKPMQFPKDEILNESDRLVRTWASVEVTDKQGDIVPIDQMRKVMNTWFKRGATMIDQHTNRPIGRGLSWKEETHPKTKTPGIVLDYQVYDDYSIDDQVWEEIKSGDREGLSIGGRALGIPQIKDDEYTGKKGNYLQDIELYEMSPVDSPANQFGKNIAINYLAKASSSDDPKEIERLLVKDLQKGFAVKDVDAPFAGFEDMDACISGQRERGHTEDSSKRICGFLMHQTDKNFIQGKCKKVEKAGEDVDVPKPKGDIAVDKGVSDYNWDVDSDNIAHIGLMVESEEHPQLDEKAAKQLVADHLSEDPTYYDKSMELFKGRTYLKPGQEAPKGVKVQEGAQGGKYYESGGAGKEPGKKPDEDRTPEEMAIADARDAISRGNIKDQKDVENLIDQVSDVHNMARSEAKQIVVSEWKADQEASEPEPEEMAREDIQHLVQAALKEDAYEPKRIAEMVADTHDYEIEDVRPWVDEEYEAQTKKDKKKEFTFIKAFKNIILKRANIKSTTQKDVKKNHWPKQFVKALLSSSTKESTAWPVDFVKALGRPIPKDESVARNIKESGPEEKNMTKKEDYKEPMPEGAPKEDDKKVPEVTPESRLDALEKSVGSMATNLEKVLSFVQKMDEDDKDEDDKDKKKEEDKPVDEEDKDKKKDVGTEDVNPSPEGGEAKLPKAPAGETDETDKPAGDKGPAIVAKEDLMKMMDAAVESKVKDVLQGMGVTKSTTPRGKHENDPVQENNAAKAEFAMDLIKRSKAGTLTTADMNRETKDFVKTQYDLGIQRVLNQDEAQ